MDYENLLKIMNYRIVNGIEPVISEQEAIEYLGDDLIQIIDLIYKFQEEYEFKIYTHGCFLESANKIIKNGYHWSSEEIDKSEFISKTGCNQIRNSDFIDSEQDGVRTFSVIVPSKCDNSTSNQIYFSQDMTQHFVQGQISYSAFLTRFIAKNKNVPCTHIVIGLVPDEDDISYFSSKYSIDFNDNDGSFQFWFEEINESQMFIGHLDVENKEFVFNRKFDSKHFLKDNLRSMTFTLDDQLLDLIHGSSGKKV